MPDNDLVDHLREQIEDLNAKLERLRHEMTGARERLDLTMKGKRICPGCGCRKILHSPQVLDRGAGTAEPLAVAQRSIWSGKGVGEFEIFICSECGLSEFYVKDPSRLLEHGKRVKLLQGLEPDKDGPYR